MSLGTILLIVLILMLIGAIPSWPHSRNWGYGPSGGIGSAGHHHRRAAADGTPVTPWQDVPPRAVPRR
jgi:hypothetical protein